MSILTYSLACTLILQATDQILQELQSSSSCSSSSSSPSSFHHASSASSSSSSPTSSSSSASDRSALDKALVSLRALHGVNTEKALEILDHAQEENNLYFSSSSFSSSFLPPSSTSSSSSSSSVPTNILSILSADVRGVCLVHAKLSGRFAFIVSSSKTSNEAYLCTLHHCSCAAFASTVASSSSSSSSAPTLPLPEHLYCKHQLAARIAYALGKFSIKEIEETHFTEILKNERLVTGSKSYHR